MRIRNLGFVALLVALLAVVGTSLGVPQTFAQADGTPVAAVPTAQSAATALSETGATPVAEPVRVITLVGWYQTDSSGDFIEIGPLQTNDQLVAGPGDPTSTLTGQADFDSPDNNELPRITLGDTILDAVEMIAGDPDSVFNWIYYGGDATLRPATLVIAVTATAGPYEGRSGTATFLSRSSPGSGTVIIMLNPVPEE